MSRASVLAAGRRAAEAGMVDTCAITRVTGETTNDLTGEVTRTTAQVYAGKCRVQQSGAQGGEEDIGEAALVVLRFELQLPMTVVGLHEADEVTITASRSDPDLPGRVFTIRDLMHKTDATARRVSMREVTS